LHQSHTVGQQLAPIEIVSPQCVILACSSLRPFLLRGRVRVHAATKMK
jgi:hypothetical protein